MSSPQPVNWLEINLSAIQSNINQIQGISGVPIMAVVKANGYGHGIVEVARAAVDVGVKWFGVARLDEALFLREHGIKQDILILGHIPPQDSLIAQENNITITLHDDGMLFGYQHAMAGTRKKIRVHAKIDTGMGRLGVPELKAFDFVQSIINFDEFAFEGIFTHMARADEPGLVTTDQQALRFEKILEELKNANQLPEWVHAANSASTLFHNKLFYTLVRPGIAIYGLDPSPETPLPNGFSPALSWKAILTEIKKMPAYHGISYGHRYVTDQEELVGTIPVGYGDGYRRVNGMQVLIHGKKAPILGSICMDQSVVSLRDIPEARVGDEVVLLGLQGDAQIRAEDIARIWGTIVYEPVCALAGRIPRFYY